MQKHELIAALYDNHEAFITYIDNLSAEQFLAGRQGKWTAGQQLLHILMSIKPIAKTLKDKAFILEKFGAKDTPALTYQQVYERYTKALADGGKAPERFLPTEVTFEQKATIIADIRLSVQTVAELLETYTTKELDTLLLPHPLLGNLAINEMLYMIAYHVTHHHQKTMQA